MKKWVLSALFVTFVQVGLVACDPTVNGGGGGSGGTGGMNAGGGGASSSSTSGSAGGNPTGSSSSSGGMLGPGDCRTSADCVEPNGGFCQSPDAAPLCGICFEPPNPCTTDAECAMQDPTTICNRPPCSCGASECMVGCMSDAECPTATHCSAGHRCVPNTCASKADCPANFDCTNMECGRKACTTDADCSGFCVNGSCYDVAGHCMLPPP